MGDVITEGSLITAAEAEEIVGAPTRPVQRIRTPLLIFTGTLMVVVATLVLLVLLSLGNSRTGWESILPFLDQSPIQSLQID